jgi:hypothetical protein
MPRRSLFTVLLAVALVLTTPAGPQASQAEHAASVSPKAFSVEIDGRTPPRDPRRG